MRSPAECTECPMMGVCVSRVAKRKVNGRAAQDKKRVARRCHIFCVLMEERASAILYLRELGRMQRLQLGEDSDAGCVMALQCYVADKLAGAYTRRRAGGQAGWRID